MKLFAIEFSSITLVQLLSGWLKAHWSVEFKMCSLTFSRSSLLASQEEALLRLGQWWSTNYRFVCPATNYSSFRNLESQPEVYLWPRFSVLWAYCFMSLFVYFLLSAILPRSFFFFDLFSQLNLIGSNENRNCLVTFHPVLWSLKALNAK